MAIAATERFFPGMNALAVIAERALPVVFEAEPSSHPTSPWAVQISNTVEMHEISRTHR
jgi:hypothetical protein